MDQALELLPADCWRWYLTANAPEGSDTAFTWEQFATAVNKDLADVLGNFVNRILKFCETRLGGVVPEGGEAGPRELQLYADIGKSVAELNANLEAIEIRKSAQAVRALWVLGNEYLAEAAPWTAMKTDPVRAGVIVRTALNLTALFARVSSPFIPFAAETIGAALGQDERSWPGEDIAAELNRLTPGAAVRTPEVLFRKIDDAQLAEWGERFGGAEA